MVLSWRAESQLSKYCIFDGSCDARMFLFYFENLVALEIEEGKKLYELLAHMDGDELEFIFSRCTKDGGLKNEYLDYEKAKKALLETFVKREQPQENISEAKDGILDVEDPNGINDRGRSD